MMRIREIFLSLINSSKDRTASLMTRNGAGAEHRELQTIGPNCERMLFPMNDVTFQWSGATPPYVLKISESIQGSEGKSVFRADVPGSSVEVPSATLHEQTAYRWTVASGLATSGGAFYILGKEESRSIVPELAALINTLPAENEAIRLLVEYGFYFDRGLYCDAQQVQAIGEKRYPKNEVFRRLALSKDKQ